MENGKHEHNDGILIHDTLLQHVITFKEINERLCYTILKDEIFDVEIICC